MYVTANGIQLSLSGAATNWNVAKNAAAHTQTGTSGNDIFYSVSGDTDAGGTGDDAYYIWNTNNTIVEKPNEGIDTVYAAVWAPYTLSANVENLVLSGAGATSGTGNALNNIIMAGSAGAMLDGKGGDDVLVGGSGYDTFRIEAGNGSDAIEKFDTTEDQVRLEGYGITSYSALKSLMTQSGADVKIALPNGETVVLRDTSLSSLSAANFQLANNSASGMVSSFSPLTSLATTGTLAKLTQAQQAVASNGWTVLNNAWGTGSMVQGRDYSMSSTYHATDLTGGTTFSWSFPTVSTSVDTSPTVRAYPELIFGNSPYSGVTSNPGDAAHVFPVQVSSIAAFTATSDLTFSGDTRGYDVSYDIWLSSSPTGDSSTVTNEVMIWLHQGDFSAYGDKIGVYTKGDFSASIYYNAATHYTAIVADSDQAASTIDVADILKTLQSMGIVSGSEYVRDVELGAEVVSGTGSLTVNNLDLSVSTTGSDGSITTKTVDGTGTTTTNSYQTVFTGTAAGQALTGNALDNTFWSYGNDTMTGLGGNDTYHVVNANDKVIEAVGGGNDTVISTVSYTLAAGQEIETLKLDPSTGTQALSLTGNEFANTLIGNDGNNFLNGGGGVDTLIGGKGNDLYVVDNALDKVIEAVGGGNDTVLATCNYTLQAGQEIETLQPLNMTATTAWTLTGNEFNNTIYSNLGADTLNGGGGDDTLVGNGKSTLIGGTGNDIFLVQAGDKVIEAVGGGDDHVLTSTSYTLDAGQEIEWLQARNPASTTGLTLTGNEFANHIIGTAGNDVINGGAGNDVISGLGGIDTLTGGLGADTFVFSDGETGKTLATADTITDFSHAQGDKIDLSRIDANTKLAGDQAFTIHASGDDHVAGAMWFTQSGADTLVNMDTDGDGKADYMIHLANVKAASLVAADFVF